MFTSARFLMASLVLALISITSAGIAQGRAAR